MKKQISIAGILEDLQNGLTRLANQDGYDPQIGSIQEKYELSAAEVKHIFKHEKLKGKKTIKQKELSFELVDDVVEDVQEVTEQQPHSDSFEHITSL